MTSDAHGIEKLRAEVVDSCRVLAKTGLVREITGHVSARIPDTDEMLVRCRRPADPGVEHTELVDVRRVDLDGRGDELTDGYQLPGEFAIHSEIYRRRPDVGAVVHGHPRSSLLCGITGVCLEPIFGAYDPAAMDLAVSGVPVYPRSVLISTIALGIQLAQAMGDANAAILAGHGVVAVGTDVAEATVRAIKLETLAEVTLQAHASGRAPQRLSEEDIAEVQDFVHSRDAARVYMSWTWDFYRRALSSVST